MNRILSQFGGKRIRMPNQNSRATREEKTMMCLRSYQQVIRFYNSVLSPLNCREREDLIDIDYNSQPDNFRHRNTLIRIFDKYLWMEGRP